MRRVNAPPRQEKGRSPAGGGGCQEVGPDPQRPRLLRRAEKTLRRGDLEDLAGVHEDHPVADLARESHFVRDADHGHAVARQRLHHLQHFADHLRIQRAGRFVEQHDRRLEGQRPGDGHALLLAAGQRAGVGLRLVRHAHPLQQLVRQRLGVAARRLQDMQRRVRHVVQHAHVRKQVELLEHEADAAAQRVDVHALGVDVLAVDADDALADGFEPVDGADERGLARARRAAHDQHFAASDLQADILEHMVLAVPLVDAF